jgi:hypothetical protein
VLADGSPEADVIGYFNTLIRYYLHQDPDTLTDAEWALTVAQLKHIRQSESNQKK